MAYSDVKTAINNGITDNGNQEITGAVLRPILIAIVDLMQEVVGNPASIGNESVIDFITNISVGGIELHTGEDSPNDTPPADYKAGDLYQQVVGGNTIAFWQFFVNEWKEIYNATPPE